MALENLTRLAFRITQESRGLEVLQTSSFLYCTNRGFELQTMCFVRWLTFTSKRQTISWPRWESEKDKPIQHLKISINRSKKKNDDRITSSREVLQLEKRRKGLTAKDLSFHRTKLKALDHNSSNAEGMIVSAHSIDLYESSSLYFYIMNVGRVICLLNRSVLTRRTDRSCNEKINSSL